MLETKHLNGRLITSVFVCMLGFMLAMLAAIFIHIVALNGVVYTFTRGSSLRLEPLAAGVAVGVLIGVAQWLVLRQGLSGSHLWIVATMIGTVIAWGMFNWVMRPAMSAMSLELGSLGFGLMWGAVWGGLVGGVQWLVLRQWMQSAHIWWLVNTVGLTLIVGGVKTIDHIIIGIIIGSILYGIIIGVTLRQISIIYATPRIT